jgi:hypothetical protein
MSYVRGPASSGPRPAGRSSASSASREATSPASTGWKRKPGRDRDGRELGQLPGHHQDQVIELGGAQFGPGKARLGHHPLGRALRLEVAEHCAVDPSVSLALLVVLDSLSPAERLAFVLHDMFELPFDEIAPLLGRSPTAARQLASRARRRVKVAEIPTADRDPVRQRGVVDAFFRAARGGDFDALVSVLHPDVVLRADFGGRRRAAPPVITGPAGVAGQANLGRAPRL